MKNNNTNNTNKTNNAEVENMKAEITNYINNLNDLYVIDLWNDFIDYSEADYGKIFETDSDLEMYFDGYSVREIMEKTSKEFNPDSKFFYTGEKQIHSLNNIYEEDSPLNVEKIIDCIVKNGEDFGDKEIAKILSKYENEFNDFPPIIEDIVGIVLAENMGPRTYITLTDRNSNKESFTYKSNFDYFTFKEPIQIVSYLSERGYKLSAKEMKEKVFNLYAEGGKAEFFNMDTNTTTDFYELSEKVDY